MPMSSHDLKSNFFAHVKLLCLVGNMAVSGSLNIVDKSRTFITEMGYRNTTEVNHVNGMRTTHGLLNSSECINN
jgi:hypothetical protein